MLCMTNKRVINFFESQRFSVRNAPLSSLFYTEPHTRSTLIPLTVGWSFVAVRDALRSGDPARIERSVTPLYNRCKVPLGRFAGNLLRNGKSRSLNVGKDSDDIAMEAFGKVFTLVVGDSGTRIRDEVHFLRTLFQAARCVLVDTQRLPDSRHSRTQSDVSESSEETVSLAPTLNEEIFGASKTALIVLELLFTDGERFGRLLRKSGAGNRHFRQYRALALYELGEGLRDDLAGANHEAEIDIVRHWRQLSVEKICIRERDWDMIEIASRSCVAQRLNTQTYLYEPIRVAVESVCGGDLQNRNKRHVLRHEMGRLLMESRTEIAMIGV